MKDNSTILSLESKLTRIGKQRLSENRFNPTKFAVSDDAVNYNLYESSLIDPYMKIKRTPLFNVSRDAASLMKSKLPINDVFEDQDITHDYGLSIERVTSEEFEGEYNTVQISGSSKPKKFPEYSSDGVKRVKYYITDNDIASVSNVMIFSFDFSSLPVNTPDQYVTVTIHDRKYFDISLNDNNIEQIQTFTNNRNIISKNFPESSDLDTSKTYTDVPKTINVMCNPVNRLSNLVVPEIVRDEGRERFENSVRLNSRFKNDIPWLKNQTRNFNSFNLYYKGNFGYKDPNTSQYDTMITLFSELTGQYENVHLSIIPTQAP